jgi:hypothetical protein
LLEYVDGVSSFDGLDDLRVKIVRLIDEHALVLYKIKKVA